MPAGIRRDRGRLKVQRSEAEILSASRDGNLQAIAEQMNLILREGGVALLGDVSGGIIGGRAVEIEGVEGFTLEFVTGVKKLHAPSIRQRAVDGVDLSPVIRRGAGRGLIARARRAVRV